MMTLTLFLVGHLIVAMVATIFIRFMNRQPDLLARRGSIFELNSRPMRIEAGEAELVTANAEVTALDKRIERSDAKIADTLPLDDLPFAMAGYMIVAWILAEGETGLVWLLSAPAHFLNLSAEAWGFVAAPFAAAWILMVHLVIGWSVADKHRPARTVRRAKLGAGLSGVVVIVGGWLTLSGRNLTNVATIEEVAGVGIMVLAALMSVCAAFCSLVASTLYEARHHEHVRAQLVALREQYKRHIEAIAKDLGRLCKEPEPPENPPTPTSAPAPEPSLTPPTAKGVVPGGIIPTAFMLVCLVSVSASAHAQPLTPKPTTAVTMEAPMRASAADFARVRGCEVLLDLTISVDRTAFKNGLVQIGKMLPLIVDKFDCGVVRITTFTGSLFNKIEETSIPIIEDPAVHCLAAQPTETARAKALGFLYPSVESAHRKDAADTCIAEAKRDTDNTVAKRQTAIAQIQDVLRAAGERQPGGPCTALQQSVQRALRRSQSVIVVTDGIGTCPAPDASTTTPEDGNLLFLLVPPDGIQENQANLLLRRISSLENDFKGANVALIPEATESFWRGFRR